MTLNGVMAVTTTFIANLQEQISLEDRGIFKNVTDDTAEMFKEEREEIFVFFCYTTFEVTMSW